MRAVFAMRAEGAAMALLHTEQIMEMGAMGKMGEMGGDGSHGRPIRKNIRAVGPSGCLGMLGCWFCLPERFGCAFFLLAEDVDHLKFLVVFDLLAILGQRREVWFGRII